MGKHVGGVTEIFELNESGELAPLLHSLGIERLVCCMRGCPMAPR